MRLLVVEDEPATRELLERGLREELFQVHAVADATSAEACAASGAFDAIILDLMLPDRDGFSVCRRLRARGIDTPILLLTGRHAVADRIRGLDVGADDYLGKPFAFEELLARLRAVTRRGRTRQLDDALTYGPIEFDHRRRQLMVDGRAVLLRKTEFRLLHYLLLHAGKPVSRDDLAQHVWDSSDHADSNVIDVYISYLRKKLGPAGSMIRTMRGIGYALTKNGYGGH